MKKRDFIDKSVKKKNNDKRQTFNISKQNKTK